MALTRAALRLLARSCAREPFGGPILTLGRQAVYATVEGLQEIVRICGGRVHELPNGMSSAPNVPGFESLPYSTYTNDEVVFMMMCGQQVHSMDVSDYKNADILHDLNVAGDPSLDSRFGTIIDGGTLGHVFHVPQALHNLSRLLRPGGRILHLNPVSNWAAHGFYQFSPTFYYDYYGANGFEPIECLLIETPSKNLDTSFASGSTLWRWDCERPAVPLISRQLLTTCFEARKCRDTPQRLPQLGDWTQSTGASRLGGSAQSIKRSFLGRARETLVRVSPVAMSLVGAGETFAG